MTPTQKLIDRQHHLSHSSLIIGRPVVGMGTTLIASIPDLAGGPDSAGHVIVAWRESDATYVVWRAFVNASGFLDVYNGEHGITELAKAIQMAYQWAGYRH